MKVLLFNGVGAEPVTARSTSGLLTGCLASLLEEKGEEVNIFNLSDAGIPFLDTRFDKASAPVLRMVEAFRDADLHIWLSPMYHGSMPGQMKNCLDWLELSGREPKPYLTDKIIGLVCWADGGQAMQGINAMEQVARSLRAWVLPYSIPIIRENLLEEEGSGISGFYRHKLDKMVNLLTRAGHFIPLGEL